MKCSAPSLPADTPKDPIGWLGSLYGAPRCGKPAVYRDPSGRLLCAECGIEAKRAHESGSTLMSILAPETGYKLTPIQ